MGSKNVSFAFENGLNKEQLRFFDIKTYLGTHHWEIFYLPKLYYNNTIILLLYYIYSTYKCIKILRAPDLVIFK